MHKIHGGKTSNSINDYGITLSSVGQGLMFPFSWVHRGSARIFLALTVRDLRAIFLVSWQYVYIVDCFPVLIHCDTLDK